MKLGRNGDFNQISPVFSQTITSEFSKEMLISLKNVTKKHNGTYVCLVNNEIQKSINLIVKCLFLLLLF